MTGLSHIFEMAISHIPEDEVVASPRLSHLSERGEARMVDVGAKVPTARKAVARATVRASEQVLRQISEGTIPKGDVLAVARIAGIQAAKRTSDLIPLCHPLRITKLEVTFNTSPSEGSVGIECTVEAHDRTGVEMEAMMGATVAALTIYDMIKAADRWASIHEVVLLEKLGGKSGHVMRNNPPP